MSLFSRLSETVKNHLVPQYNPGNPAKFLVLPIGADEPSQAGAIQASLGLVRAAVIRFHNVALTKGAIIPPVDIEAIKCSGIGAVDIVGRGMINFGGDGVSEGAIHKAAIVHAVRTAEAAMQSSGGSVFKADTMSAMLFVHMTAHVTPIPMVFDSVTGSTVPIFNVPRFVHTPDDTDEDHDEDEDTTEPEDHDDDEDTEPEDHDDDDDDDDDDVDVAPHARSETGRRPTIHRKGRRSLRRAFRSGEMMGTASRNLLPKAAPRAQSETPVACSAQHRRRTKLVPRREFRAGTTMRGFRGGVALY